MKSFMLRGFLLLVIFSMIISACSPTIISTPTETTAPKPTQGNISTAIIAAPTATRAESTASPTPAYTATTRPAPTLNPDPSAAASENGVYRNLFKEYLGKSDTEVQAKLKSAWQQLFYGNDLNNRVYYPVGSDMAYIEDIGNSDVRTEGMSYGMMIAVQMDKKEEFDRIWKWSRTYMYLDNGPNKGYFAWHCKTDGTRIDLGPAPDGEEWFAMALFFASARWGDGTGIFNYRQEANNILHVMQHKTDENQSNVYSMFDPNAKIVVFTPDSFGAHFTDPSYHLPAYYELWSRWADNDNSSWKQATRSSRDFFKKAADPKTGLMADYTQFDGQPY